MAKTANSINRQVKASTTVAASAALPEGGAAIAEYDSHALLAGQCFYTLPEDLLTLILTSLGKNRFDDKLIELEFNLSCQDGDSGKSVGRWQGSWIHYNLLQNSFSANQLGDSHQYSTPDTSPFARPFTINHLYSDRGHRGVFQSYVGWLLTNAQFLDEHDELLKRNCLVIRRWGIFRARTSPLLQYLYPEREDPETDADWGKFCSERDMFYFRWRLSGMAGPYLPIPIGSDADAGIPVSYFIWSQEQTGLYLLYAS